MDLTAIIRSSTFLTATIKGMVNDETLINTWNDEDTWDDTETWTD